MLPLSKLNLVLEWGWGGGAASAKHRSLGLGVGVRNNVRGCIAAAAFSTEAVSM